MALNVAALHRSALHRTGLCLQRGGLQLHTNCRWLSIVLNSKEDARTTYAPPHCCTNHRHHHHHHHRHTTHPRIPVPPFDPLAPPLAHPHTCLAYSPHSPHSQPHRHFHNCRAPSRPSHLCSATISPPHALHPANYPPITQLAVEAPFIASSTPPHHRAIRALLEGPRARPLSAPVRGRGRAVYFARGLASSGFASTESRGYIEGGLVDSCAGSLSSSTIENRGSRWSSLLPGGSPYSTSRMKGMSRPN